MRDTPATIHSAKSRLKASQAAATLILQFRKPKTEQREEESVE